MQAGAGDGGVTSLEGPPTEVSARMKTRNDQDESPSRLIDARIKELDDWRGKTLSRVRTLIQQAVPEVVEEWKWSVPVWSHAGLICTGETYKRVVKLTFSKGARSRTLRDCSIPASKARSGARSISMRVMKSTKRRSRRS